MGVVPALSLMSSEQNPPEGPILLSSGQLILWSLALAFIGVFCAVPLRTQTILREKLRFPSGLPCLSAPFSVVQAQSDQSAICLVQYGDEGCLLASSCSWNACLQCIVWTSCMPPALQQLCSTMYHNAVQLPSGTAVSHAVAMSPCRHSNSSCHPHFAWRASSQVA